MRERSKLDRSPALRRNPAAGAVARQYRPAMAVVGQRKPVDLLGLHQQHREILARGDKLDIVRLVALEFGR